MRHLGNPCTEEYVIQHMKSVLFFLLIVLASCTYVQQGDQPMIDRNIQGEPGNFHGFTMYSFTFQDRPCRVVVPDRPAKGKPWLWRARFFGHRPEVDLALLKKGFYVAYIDVTDLYGNDEAVALWDRFYNLMTSRYHLAKKVTLEGMSRGGLILFNWAAQNADKVACIYADAPVIDIKSWPGGLQEGIGSEEDWRKCLAAYHLTEAEALTYDSQLLAKADSLTKHQIPLLVVSGDSDEIVPYAENAKLVVDYYQDHREPVKVILKKGIGHVHGLDNAQPIIQFILKHH